MGGKLKKVWSIAGIGHSELKTRAGVRLKANVVLFYEGVRDEKSFKIDLNSLGLLPNISVKVSHKFQL